MNLYLVGPHKVLLNSYDIPFEIFECVQFCSGPNAICNNCPEPAIVLLDIQGSKDAPESLIKVVRSKLDDPTIMVIYDNTNDFLRSKLRKAGVDRVITTNDNLRNLLKGFRESK